MAPHVKKMIGVGHVSTLLKDRMAESKHHKLRLSASPSLESLPRISSPLCRAQSPFLSPRVLASVEMRGKVNQS